MDKLVKPYQWNETFNKLREFGVGFVDNRKSLMTSKWQGDAHAILYKFSGERIPDWIRNSIPYKVQFVHIFSIGPRSVGIIHKDGVDKQCAFNIPIANTDNSSMDWFDPDEYSDLLISVDNYTTETGKVRVTKEQLLIGKEVETTPYFSKTIDCPSLVNINEFHRIDNRKSDQFRWVLSLRFLGNPSFADVEKVFDKKFI